MNLGILKESKEEARVSITPDVVALLKKLEINVIVETGAGDAAFYKDADYQSIGAEIASREEVYKKSDIVAMIYRPDDIAKAKSGAIIIGNFMPLFYFQEMKMLAEKKLTVMSLDAIPRITRAQNMDILSSQATASGYKAVLYAAMHLPHFFPMLTTAAGTITPAKVLVIGAGVAGLQAVATAKRLGGSIDVFDTRPEVKEQVQSLGAKFVEVEGAADASHAGGYAVEQSEDYKRKQKELIHKFAVRSDVIITTALIPGKKAPLLITKEMVNEMRPGSVIVDLASGFGGNCELSKNQEIISVNGVTIVGHPNLPGTIPADASKMFAKNTLNFIKLLLNKENKLVLNFDDEIIKGACIAHDGSIVNEAVKNLNGG